MKTKLLFLVAFLIAALPELTAQDATSSDYQGFAIRQKKNLYPLKSGKNTLELKRMAFNIEFDLESGVNDSEWYDWTVFQVAATDNAENLEYFCEGPITEDNPFFSPGSGLAGPANGEYEEMVVANYGNHYILFEDESRNRVTIIQEKNEDLMRCKWTVDSFYIVEGDFPNAAEDKRLSIKKSKFNTLYLMLLIDRNNNQVIEEGEYSIVTINFR